jgi:aryl-alcohol dehydrogenase-like predicted oxidoreductase
METCPFGRTGIRVPVLGFGAMQVGRHLARRRDEFVRSTKVGYGVDGLALRFSAYAPGVDCVIVRGADARHLEKNIAAMSAGPLRPEQLAAIRGAFSRPATNWRGLV